MRVFLFLWARLLCGWRLLLRRTLRRLKLFQLLIRKMFQNGQQILLRSAQSVDECDASNAQCLFISPAQNILRHTCIVQKFPAVTYLRFEACKK